MRVKMISHSLAKIIACRVVEYADYDFARSGCLVTGNFEGLTTSSPSIRKPINRIHGKLVTRVAKTLPVYYYRGKTSTDI